MGGKNKPKGRNGKAARGRSQRSAARPSGGTAPAQGRPGDAGQPGEPYAQGHVQGHAQGGAQDRGQDRAQERDFAGSQFRYAAAQQRGTQYNTFVQQYAPAPSALDSLPDLPAEFTGRDEDLAPLLALFDPGAGGGPGGGPGPGSGSGTGGGSGAEGGSAPASGSASARPVAVVAGMGGVGKTTLAYAVGHEVLRRGWFTGVLLVDLRGYDPQPALPEQSLDALLRRLGVPPEHIPPTGADREVFYRSHLAERARKGERLLVIADNASSAAQVRPLLPPGPHGLIATSRKALPGIGRPRSLHQLQPDDAVTLLDLALREADPEDLRVREDREAAEKVVTACGCLPLALQIVAALLVQDPGEPLAERAARLTAGEGRLDSIDDGERDLRTVFGQTFESLTPQQQDLFRMLSLNAGPDISTAAAAALTHQTETAIDHQLGRLAAAHMLSRGATRGRWQMHDLLRDYAEEQAAAHVADNRPARRKYDQARGRLVDHYVKWGEAARAHVEFSLRLKPSPLFIDRDAALRWLDEERGNLTGTAHDTAPSPGSVRLGFALVPYLHARQMWDDALVVAALCLDSIQASGDRLNEPAGWGNLGRALQELSQHEEALDAYSTACDLFRRAGDVDREANCWSSAGLALRRLRRYDEALDAQALARELFELADSLDGQAATWNERGNVLYDTGRYDEALAAHVASRALNERVGNSHSVAIDRNNIGTALRALGRYEEAVTEGGAAAETLEGDGDLTRAGEAYAELAVTLAASGAPDAQVRDTWLRSASCYETAGAADKARESRAKAEGDADRADAD